MSLQPAGGRVPPPGDYIREELKKRAWTQEDLAHVLGDAVARVNKIITGKQELSPETALALETALGISAAEWLQREAAYRLSLARSGGEDDIKRRARLHELAPMKEMAKRGWIRQTDSLAGQEREVQRFYQIGSIEEEPSIHGALRKTAPSIAVSSQQRAWAFRVRQVATAIPAASVGFYDDAKIDACRRDLRKLASYSAGAQKAPALLMRYGIRYVVVEGLSGAKVDGFATWLDEQSPVIGMSLRFDRLDSFWFTLAHELTHIKYRDIAAVDGDVASHEDPLFEVKSMEERRADEEAASMLVPPDELKSFILRVGPLYSTEKINQFANRIKMHPNIIIGQLKNLGEIGWSKHTKDVVAVREAVVKAAVTDGWGKSINIGDIL